MKLALLSLLMGLVVGVLYSLVGVRSPAPPVVALVGLLGMLLAALAVQFVLQGLRDFGFGG